MLTYHIDWENHLSNKFQCIPEWFFPPTGHFYNFNFGTTRFSLTSRAIDLLVGDL